MTTLACGCRGYSVDGGTFIVATFLCAERHKQSDFVRGPFMVTPKKTLVRYVEDGVLKERMEDQ